MKFVAITNSMPIFFQDVFLYRDMLLIFLLCVFFSKHVYVNVLFLLVCLEFNTYIHCAFIVEKKTGDKQEAAINR